MYDTHLSSDNADDRIAQARRVAALVREDRPPCAIVAGDLNTGLDDLVEVLREFHNVGLSDFGGDVTNPSIAPTRRLDFVLLPDGARLIGLHTPPGGEEWAAMSDHLPVTVEFETS